MTFFRDDAISRHWKEQEAADISRERFFYSEVDNPADRIYAHGMGVRLPKYSEDDDGLRID